MSEIVQEECTRAAVQDTVGSQINPRLSQRPGWKDEGKFISVSVSRNRLGKGHLSWSQCLGGVNAAAPGEPTLPPVL